MTVNARPPSSPPGDPGDEDDGLPLRWAFIIAVSLVVGLGTGSAAAVLLGPFGGVAAGIAAGLSVAVPLHGLIRRN